MNANELFEKAMKRIKIGSIRKWAASAQNKPKWVKIAGDAINRGGRLSNPDYFAAYIASWVGSSAQAYEVVDHG